MTTERPQAFLLKQLTPQRPAIAIALFSGATGAGLAVAQAYLLSRVIARVFLGGQGLEDVTPLLGWLAIAILLRALVTFAAETSSRLGAITIKQTLREALLWAIFTLGPAYTTRERTGELANTATEGVEALDAYFSQFLPALALAAIIPAAILIAVFPLDLLSGMILLITAPLIPLFMVLIGNLAESTTRRQWAVLSRLSAHFLDTIQGLTTLKQLGQSRNQARVIDRMSQRYRAATLEVLRVAFLSALILELVATLSTAILAVEISLRLLAGGIGFEPALFILVLAPEFYLPLRTLGIRFHAGAGGVAAARRIAEVLAQPVAPQPSQPQPLPAPPYTIRFEAVSYTYPGSDTPAVDGVSFEIHPYERVALVGPSGAGKSTLFSLLLGFIRPDSGRILVNEVDLQALPVEAWRTQVAWASQSPHLFNATLAENIALADPKCSHADIRRAAGLAGLDTWIASLPGGYATQAGEQGARLSGGEAQRVALARAFLKDAPVLLLDEPAASLDPALEERLLASLERLSENRSVLAIAHRLATAERADRILVLEQGRIAESGKHAELLAYRGSYQRLASAGKSHLYGGLA